MSLTFSCIFCTASFCIVPFLASFCWA
jgi:hypothetical protein